jgi:molecular chaperone DnaK
MNAQYRSATVGIDLGGTSARIAVVDEKGDVHVLRDPLGRTSLRTDVFLDPDSLHPVVGERATALALRQPDGLLRHVVEGLERDRSHVWALGNREYRPRDLCSLILRELKQRADSVQGASHAEAVIAVPSHLGATAREEIRRAGEEAGFQAIELLDAALAATMEVPLDGQTDRPQNLLVCDLGGTTLDVAVVQVAGALKTVIALHGDHHLGGDAWDAVLVDHAARCFKEQGHEDPRADPASYLALLESARVAKEQLSANEAASIVVSLEGAVEEVPIRRVEFEQLTAPLVARARAVLERAVADASAEGLRHLVLSGGGTLMPQIGYLVRDVTGIDPSAGDPVTRIARGAAVYGAARLATRLSLPTIGTDDKEEESPDAALYVGPASPRVYGIPIKNEEGRPAIQVLLRQGTALPATVRMTFRLSRSNPTHIPITVVECDREDADPSSHLVRLALDGSISELPPGLPAGQPVDVCFKFDAQGGINAHAEIDTSDGRYVCSLSRTAPERGTTMPTVAVDRVSFAVTAPHIVSPGASFVIDVWAYLEHQRRQMVERAHEEASGQALRIKSKGPVRVSRGVILTVRVRVDRLIVQDAEDTILWEGEIGNANFAVTVPEDTREGTHQGTALIYVDGLSIARIQFGIHVGQGASEVERMPSREERFRKAFASYASADRDAVLARVQGILKAAPHLDIFVDVAKLRSGQDWQKELWRVIPLSDVFYLFWSGNAASSVWVEREWRCALQSRGLDFIDPVPLVPPESVPPPPELGGKHFNDWVLAFMRAGTGA